ncbi:ChaN family lipoprotein [Vibrio sp. DW001]|uniref:ChaN family lipoprotein n=1 Tax=Vibrio sp. DW001 TaxID=2912315 RepID=UPI0023B12B4F|nr:ChaN family lipoprotein [Vibrio sp. DW001]WED26453.1 ChaN family lipoprotein [Vibrio sp. DW001]
MRRISFLLVLFLSVGCVQKQTQHAYDLSNMYDYQLTRSGAPISLSTFVDEIATADVVLVGEWHSHSGVHHFQADLLQALDAENIAFVLAMEQFSRDKQSIIDDYLKGNIGEQALIKQGDAWSNYPSDYRPLIEYAKINVVPVIAANAPNDIVRCINKEGLGYLNKLPDEKRSFVAQEIETGDSPYKKKFIATMHHGTEAKINTLFAAQITRDETMGESIVRILNKYPNHKVILTAGKFHTEGGLGVGASVHKLAPERKIVVVDPVSIIATDSVDKYQLNVLPNPPLYVSGEKYDPSFHFLGKKNEQLNCD